MFMCISVYEFGGSRIEFYDEFIPCGDSGIKNNLLDFYKVIWNIYGSFPNSDDYFYSLDELNDLDDYILIK